MKKILVFLLIWVLVLIPLVSIASSSGSNYVKIPQYTHSHTKAICDSENFCQDYEIFCDGKTPLKMSPITGAAVQFSENWKDPRDEKTKSKFC
ncbi:MAG: hypothetical protein Q8P79_02115 [Nanoarchaeota archaeon]|nr:hypothetical protein [Nanoarchaeota archaeon]